MEQELTFRTAVGGYRKDEVIEYVENLNDEMFRVKKELEDERTACQARIRELESILKQEEANSVSLAQEQEEKQRKLAEENAELVKETARLAKALEEMEEKWKCAKAAGEQADSEKQIIKDKLAREILRLRAENRTLRENWKEAERNVGSRADYEAIRGAVSEVQFKIAEYVNVINKTQQSLAETYQSMNGIKKKIAAEIEKEIK